MFTLLSLDRLLAHFGGRGEGGLCRCGEGGLLWSNSFDNFTLYGSDWHRYDWKLVDWILGGGSLIDFCLFGRGSRRA